MFVAFPVYHGQSPNADIPRLITATLNIHPSHSDYPLPMIDTEYRWPFSMYNFNRV